MCSQSEERDVKRTETLGFKQTVWVRLSASQIQRVVVFLFVRTTDEPVPRLPRFG